MKTTENTVLITGGASGIGLAFTKLMVQLKNKVIIAGRNSERLINAKNLFQEIETIKCDITKQNDIETLLVSIENNYPQLNMLINNAGIQYNYSMIEELNVTKKIEEEITSNLIAPIKFCSLLIPVLANKNESAIINVTSALAISPKENAPVYSASKAGLHSFTKTLRYQCENTSIKVFELIPPLVDTDMTKGRGKNKIDPEQVVRECIKSLNKNNYQIRVGKVKLLHIINRINQGLTDKILRKMN